MTFAPIFYGLDCGAYPEKPKGSWHNHGYEMIGMFKKDWERIGGKLKIKKKVVLLRMFSIFYRYWVVGILSLKVLFITLPTKQMSPFDCYLYKKCET